MTFDERQAWERLIDDTRQHRKEYLHLLHLDEDQVGPARLAGKTAQIKHLEVHMRGLKQLILEVDAILAADAELTRLRGQEG